ncbi:MAG TPA: hypothetical protein VGI81_14100 [Tepidisphaeraceae bacterium]|jgi:hypothetical protein
MLRGFWIRVVTPVTVLALAVVAALGAAGGWIGVACRVACRLAPEHCIDMAEGTLTGDVLRSAAATVLAVLLIRFRRRLIRPRTGLCRKCGYDLRASKELCPECGTPIRSPETITDSAK